MTAAMELEGAEEEGKREHIACWQVPAKSCQEQMLKLPENFILQEIWVILWQNAQPTYC